MVKLTRLPPTWRVSQGVTPPVKAGSRDGSNRLTFWKKTIRGREAVKLSLPTKNRQQDDRPYIRT